MTAIEVLFKDQETAHKYQKQIEQFLRQLLSEREESFCIRVKERKTEDEGSRSLNDECSNVMVNGSPSTVPLYDCTFDDTLGNDENTGRKSYLEEDAEVQKMTCFNCLGDHHLNDCTQEHDASRIASNKRDFMDSSTVRYHMDDVQPIERTSSVRPGCMSNELRNALSLREDQLPLYIYHMRILGYPPGWLKEAEIEDSGLSLYDSDGIVTEDGKEGKTKKYDGKNFFSFPGFNAPIPDGVVDEWKQLRMLPMQPHQQLSEALKHTCVIVSHEYKKRKKDADFNEGAKKCKEEIEHSCSTGNQKSSSVNTPCSKKNESRTPASIMHGSPLVDTGNMYKRLPDSNKFSVGITEHIPYENLPDSVGAYDAKMKGVLSQVRQNMGKLQE